MLLHCLVCQADLYFHGSGPSISLDDDDCDDDKPGPSSGPPPSDVDEVTKKSKSQQQLKGEQIVKRILRSGVAGTSYSYR